MAAIARCCERQCGHLTPMALAVLMSAASAAFAGQELVMSGGAEAGSAPWLRQAISTDEAHSGKHCVKLDNSAGKHWAAAAYTKVLPLRPHVPYRMSVWVKRRWRRSKELLPEASSATISPSSRKSSTGRWRSARAISG